MPEWVSIRRDCTLPHRGVGVLLLVLQSLQVVHHSVIGQPSVRCEWLSGWTLLPDHSSDLIQRFLGRHLFLLQGFSESDLAFWLYPELLLSLVPPSRCQLLRVLFEHFQCSLLVGCSFVVDDLIVSQ